MWPEVGSAFVMAPGPSLTSFRGHSEKQRMGDHLPQPAWGLPSLDRLTSGNKTRRRLRLGPLHAPAAWLSHVCLAPGDWDHATEAYENYLRRIAHHTDLGCACAELTSAVLPVPASSRRPVLRREATAQQGRTLAGAPQIQGRF